MEFSVVDKTGKDTGRKVSLSDSIVGIEPNEHVVYLDVKQYLAAQRQGTHKSKERAEIAGSTRKIKRQKGTGTARAGSLKSPIFRSGGRVFGPKPRNYDFKLNKKEKALARRSVLAAKAKGEGLTFLEDFTLETPKTKTYLEMLQALKLSEQKTLLVLAEADTNVTRSGRNLPKVKVTTVDRLTTYDMVNADQVILTEKSVETLEKLLA